MKLYLIVGLLLASIEVFSQIDYTTGWQEQNLMYKPKKVSVSHILFTEKFGEPVEERIGVDELTFNGEGYYLSKSSINLKNKDKNKTTTYQYDSNSGYLISIDYDAEYFMTADYTYKFEWENGLISKQVIIERTSGTQYIEYKYDNQKRNIEEIIYDKRKNISKILRYEYDGSQLIDAKQYDNTGTLIKHKKWIYNSMKNLIRFEEYQRENDDMVLNIKNRYKYNENKDIIEDDNCNYYSYGGWKCYNKSFTYEYYPNGLIKKRTEYGKDITGIEEYKSYDNHDNWTEKVIWSPIHPNELHPSEKFVREIEYF
nr:hypothetical protein [uncultured Draconibacterium sp.]